MIAQGSANVFEQAGCEIGHEEEIAFFRAENDVAVHADK
jgi:hypothetical protein